MTDKQKNAVKVLNRLHAPTAEQINMLTDDEYMMLLEMVLDCDRPKIEYYPFYPYTPINPIDKPLEPYYYKPYCTTTNTAEKNDTGELFRL